MLDDSESEDAPPAGKSVVRLSDDEDSEVEDSEDGADSDDGHDSDVDRKSVV